MTDIVEQLVNKVSAELETLEQQLLTKTPREVIDSAYEITLKREFVSILTNEDVLSDLSLGDQAKALAVDNLLDWIYQRWLNCDISFSDTLRDAIDYAFDTVGLPEPRTSVF